MPTMRRRDELAACLKALEDQTLDRSRFEVVLADDAAGEPAETRPVPDWVRVVRADVPGASAARNAGWRAAHGDVVVFLDDDIRARPDLLARHMAHHEAHPEEQASLLGRVVWAPELELTPFMHWVEDGVQFDYGSIGDQAQWWHLYSCNASVKRSLLERVDGFDEVNFPFGYEDLDLGRRMSEHGIEVTFDEKAIGDHLVPITLEGFENRMPRIAESEWMWIHRWPEFPPFFRNKVVLREDEPRARGRGVKLILRIPRGVPVIGEYIWKSADAYYLQRLAPHFMKVWREFEAAEQPASHAE